MKIEISQKRPPYSKRMTTEQVPRLAGPWSNTEITLYVEADSGNEVKVTLTEMDLLQILAFRKVNRESVKAANNGKLLDCHKLFKEE